MSERESTSGTAVAGARQTEIAVLAGGCFWGVEDILRDVPGVIDTDVGYTGGWLENPTYHDTHDSKSGHAEAVRITFDPSVLSYEDLLEKWFFRLHDPTTLNRQGNDIGTQYRSAIFPQSPEQRGDRRARDRARRRLRQMAPPDHHLHRARRDLVQRRVAITRTICGRTRADIRVTSCGTEVRSRECQAVMLIERDNGTASGSISLPRPFVPQPTNSPTHYATRRALSRSPTGAATSPPLNRFPITASSEKAPAPATISAIAEPRSDSGNSTPAGAKKPVLEVHRQDRDDHRRADAERREPSE